MCKAVTSFPVRAQSPFLRRLKKKKLVMYTGGQEQEGIYYQGITGMKADMSGARTTPKLLELQGECLARDLDNAAESSSSDESSDDEFDADAIPGLACLEAPSIPAALEQHNGAQVKEDGHAAGAEQQSNVDCDQSSESGSSQSGSDVLEAGGDDLKAVRKAHKKAVKEANRERRKHKMPKHVKKKKMAKSHKK